MGTLEDLIATVSDTELRDRLDDEFRELKRQKRFGLVFEEHLPEVFATPSLPIQVGATVRDRAERDGDLYRVIAVEGEKARVERLGDGAEPREKPAAGLQVVKRSDEPVYPTLHPLGSIGRSDERPWHAVVNGENFHALQLLLYLYEGRVDCIYLDPPYNTGARDWKYNNRFVDERDSWRHSKWLAFMEKRLVLAKRLLKPDGVLICTVDEHEVHHLGMLLEQVFPEYDQTMVTAVINPKGTAASSFARVSTQPDEEGPGLPIRTKAGGQLAVVILFLFGPGQLGNRLRGKGGKVVGQGRHVHHQAERLIDAADLTFDAQNRLGGVPHDHPRLVAGDVGSQVEEPITGAAVTDDAADPEEIAERQTEGGDEEGRLHLDEAPEGFSAVVVLVVLQDEALLETELRVADEHERYTIERVIKSSRGELNRSGKITLGELLLRHHQPGP